MDNGKFDLEDIGFVLENIESQGMEYKQSWKDDYLKWVCGFANAQGGILYIGVEDNGSVCGVKGARKLLEDIPNKVSNLLGIMVDVNVRKLKGVEFLEIRIPQCASPVAYKGKYYYRSGSTLQELTGVALHDFILRKMNISWDASIVSGATIDDIDRSSVVFFLQSAIRAKRVDERTLNDSTDKILRNLKLMNEQGQLTIAALLLFGNDVEKWSMTAKFKIGRFGQGQADLIIQDSVACPLILMPNKVISLLMGKYLVSPIHYDGLQRVESLEIPEDALREMVCNAIVHRDYLGSFIQMRVWDDRIEMWNPGILPPEMTVDMLFEVHESCPRNNLIANTFYLAGFIESWGRGYEKIKCAFKDEKLQVPVFEQVRGGFQATILRERFMSIQGKTLSLGDERMYKWDALSPVGDSMQKSMQKSMRKSMQKILELIAGSPEITLTEMANHLGMTRNGVDKNIRKLKDLGIIRRVGADKGGFWEIVSSDVKRKNK